MNGDAADSAAPDPGLSGADDPNRDQRQQGGFFGALRRVFAPIPVAEPGGETDEADPATAAKIDQRRDARRSMIERVIAFDQKRVSDVMAPRADIYAVDVDTPFDDLVEKFTEAGHSRMPVYRDDLDDPLGMIHIKDVIARIAEKSDVGAALVLNDLRREILYAPPSMLVTDLLLRMQASRIHMALVIDEFGGTDGLVTIEDLIEEIVGEINDEHDEEDDEPAIVPYPGGGWNIDARVAIEELTDAIGAAFEIGDDEEIDTVGGYVVSLAGRVPQRGEVISANNGIDIEVIEADARRLRKLRIRPPASTLPDAAE